MYKMTKNNVSGISQEAQPSEEMFQNFLDIHAASARAERDV